MKSFFKKKLFSGEETAADMPQSQYCIQYYWKNDDRNYDKYFLNRGSAAQESSKKLIHQLASKKKSFRGDINLCNVPALML